MVRRLIRAFRVSPTSEIGIVCGEVVRATVVAGFFSILGISVWILTFFWGYKAFAVN